MILKRKKPKFLRQHWYRYLRLGKTVKSKRKWRHLTGGDSKMRLRVRGKPDRPTIGWGAEKSNKGKVDGFVPVRVETLSQLDSIKKGEAIIIARIGKKKQIQITAEANKKGIKILNKYRKEKNATK